jgi:hypothetical protein
VDETVTSYHLQLGNLELSEMVGAPDHLSSKRRMFVISNPIMSGVVNARDAADSKPPKVNNARGTQVVYIRTDPAAIVEFQHVVRGLMVAADKDGRDWSCRSSIEIVLKVALVTIFRRTSHAVQVIPVANGLET